MKKNYFDHPKTVSEDGLLIEFAKGDSFMKMGHILRGLEWPVAALFGRFAVGRLLGPFLVVQPTLPSPV